MEWTDLHQQLADYALKQIYDSHPNSCLVNFQSFYNERHLKFTRRDEALALTKLEQENLIDIPSKNRNLCDLTSLGNTVIEDYSSYSGYLAYLKKLREKEIIQAKKNKRQEWAKNHLVWLQISKHWIGIVAFISSVGFNVYFYTDYSKLKSLIKPIKEEQATKVDSVPESQINKNYKLQKLNK